jgi:hypothetical protein
MEETEGFFEWNYYSTFRFISSILLFLGLFKFLITNSSTHQDGNYMLDIMPFIEQAIR